ncbi:transcriptional regulator [Dysgonomonas sp. 521]|uniref:RrF2 family transcriptional regulator n=1 Tax=Dysgonomonas sp. 521 TaxID=2302932 RepID=UPI0013D76933|nr:Rrf2 family transcriptional regulator [Dysgonomonas sp. 521]NDV94359.1 transcriptional regulator [Dysgonomonas sp. 521]
MNDRRFAISIHILVLLAKNPDKLLASDYLAGSMNINPVLVRKELSNLRKHGIVISKEGKHGGCMLARPAAEIYLSDVYKTVSSHTILGNELASPNPQCPVGKQINEHLNKLNLEAENIMVRQLSGQTLADFSNRFS